MNSLIITGGSFDKTFACTFYHSKTWDYVIGVDKGVEYAWEMEVPMDAILGDFDSIAPDKKERLCQPGIYIEEHPSQKDETDTILAVHHAIEKGCDSITILCGTGTRLDHTLANISILAECLENNIDCEIVDAHNRIRMIRDSLKLEKEEQYGQYVSLLAYSSTVTGVTLTGFAYPLKDAILYQKMGLGVSNEIVEQTATIQIEEGILLVIEARE
ncbi:MAG: thiamine diphosphokinase [Lachnospiraceae bacterium]